MLFSIDWPSFVVLSILKISSINCFDQTEIGTVSSVFATMGNRSSMEDYFIRIEGDSRYGIFGVFDGHGGDYAAKFAAEFFPQKIQSESEQFASTSTRRLRKLRSRLSFERVLRVAIHEAEAHLEKEFVEKRQCSGTTCLLVIAEERKLTIANVGDSRAVMCNIDGTAFDLSTDHKPNNAIELERIENEGGQIYLTNNFKVWRVKGLAMSRSLGDHDIKLGNKIIIADPDISTVHLDEHCPLFMIIASDGIWNVISSQDAVDFIRARYSFQKDFGAMDLATHARYALHGPHSPSNDNITVVIVVFRNGHYEVGSTSA